LTRLLIALLWQHSWVLVMTEKHFILLNWAIYNAFSLIKSLVVRFHLKPCRRPFSRSDLLYHVLSQLGSVRSWLLWQSIPMVICVIDSSIHPAADNRTTAHQPSTPLTYEHSTEECISASLLVLLIEFAFTSVLLFYYLINETGAPLPESYNPLYTNTTCSRCKYYISSMLTYCQCQPILNIYPQRTCETVKNVSFLIFTLIYFFLFTVFIFLILLFNDLN